MKVQFLYHPENDEFIASKIIDEIGLKQNYQITKLKKKDLGTNQEFRKAIEESDLLVLLIGATFNKVPPYIWASEMNKKPMFGIKIHNIADEWGEKRKNKGKVFDSFIWPNGELGLNFKIYDVPDCDDQYKYIGQNFKNWVSSAKNNKYIT